MKIYCVCLYVSDSWMRGFSCQIEQKIQKLHMSDVDLVVLYVLLNMQLSPLG